MSEPAAAKPYSTLKRTPMRRTPMRRQVNAAGESTIAGVLWPAGWIPEEPLKGYKRYRDDCFRWRVEDLLAAGGWAYWHLTDAKRSDPGVPDLWCLRDRIMFLELKVRNRDGKANGMSPAQYAFAARIHHAGGEYHCITWPDSWDELEKLVAR